MKPSVLVYRLKYDGFEKKAELADQIELARGL